MKISWTKSLYTKLGGTMLFLAISSTLVLITNISTLNGVKSALGKTSYIGRERVGYQILYLVGQILDGRTQSRSQGASDLQELMSRTEQMLEVLIEGNARLDMSPETDPEILAHLRRTQRTWLDQVEPLLERAIGGEPANVSASTVDELTQSVLSFTRQIETGVDLMQQSAAERLHRAQILQLAFSAVVVVILLLVLGIVRHVARRARALSDTAVKISNGDLDQVAPATGSDELALLGSAFNDMTEKLASMLKDEREVRVKLEELVAAITDTVQSLSSSATEILAGTTQQATGMREQSSAVAEAVTSIDEVLQTADQAAQRAAAVAESNEHAVEVSGAGRKAVDETVAVMHSVKDQTEAIATGIVSLAQHGQVIGEIVAAVTDIADQTNLLAVNAAIEASRAGEHGKGFTVVAREIRALADQSKKATAQVRQILGEIQKATETAVMSTEQGVKSVSRALESVDEAGETIRTLEAMIADAARSAAQIAASAGQQTTGMKQIHRAMLHINQVSSQNLAATRQSEQAAKDLNELGTRLKNLLVGHGR